MFTWSKTSPRPGALGMSICKKKDISMHASGLLTRERTKLIAI
jgi:hypothetical protein